MKPIRWLVVAVLLVVSGALSAVACGGNAGKSDGGVDSGAPEASPDVVTEGGFDGGGGPFLTELSVTSMGGGEAGAGIVLTPAFSPTINDYYVRCPATAIPVTVTFTPIVGATAQLSQPTSSKSAPSMQTIKLTIDENQAVVAVASKGAAHNEYWVRCLPSDFPAMTWQPHPSAGTPTPGYYLLGTDSQFPGYAWVLDRNGVPVWYHRDAHHSGMGDTESTLKNVVAYVPGSGTLPIDIVSISPSAESSAAPKDENLDIHELRYLPSSGHYVVVSSPDVEGIDLTGLRTSTGQKLGKNETIQTCNVLEFDAKTGAIVWTWKALDHLDPKKVTQSVESGDVVGDASVPDGSAVRGVFHCNAIDVDPANGNLLVSLRQLNSVVYVDRSGDAGTVLWKMGGSDASLDDAPYIPVDTPFYGQHDARLRPGWSACMGGEITMLDDHTGGPGPDVVGRADRFKVTLGKAGTCGGSAGTGAPEASLIWQYKGTSQLAASGSFRIGEDGSLVIGWGLLPTAAMTEVDDAGHDLLDLAPAPGTIFTSYRALKLPLSQFDLEAMRQTAGKP